MDVSQNRPPGRDAPDEELIDTLIAISVIAKRLAEKLRKQMGSGGKEWKDTKTSTTAW